MCRAACRAGNRAARPGISRQGARCGCSSPCSGRATCPLGRSCRCRSTARKRGLVSITLQRAMADSPNTPRWSLDIPFGSQQNAAMRRVLLFGAPSMTLRELTGLVLLVGGTALVPLGWIVSHKVLLISFLLLVVGFWLFYTERMIKREERQAKECSGSGGCNSAPMPADIHNYTGWRTGGRTQPLDSVSSDRCTSNIAVERDAPQAGFARSLRVPHLERWASA